MYMFDTHVHTMETSQCGRVSAVDAVHLYKNAGYSGIVITDHYFNGYFDKLTCKTWSQKIDSYLRGYFNAVSEGNRVGLNVFLGLEIRFFDSPNDYLVYGVDEYFLVESPELYKLGLKNFRHYIANTDILIFQAHPYRDGITTADPFLLDGVEVFNGNPRHDSRNGLAYSFARENNLFMLSGSDFHRLEDLARGGIVVAENIDSQEKLVRIIKGNKIINLLHTDS